MSDTVKVNLIAELGVVGGEYTEEYDTDINREEWDSMSDSEKKENLEDALINFRNDCIDVYFKEIE